MPNWCSNRLVIRGDGHALSSLLTAHRTDDEAFSFEGSCPMPKELRSVHTGGCNIDGVSYDAWLESTAADGIIVKTPLTRELKQSFREQFGSDNWYDWANDNWGTKWDASSSNVDADEDEGVAEVDFETAWGPPTAFVTGLAAKYPMFSITLMYAEPGMGFGGMKTFEDGELTEGLETSTNSATAALSAWHSLVVGEIDDEDEQPEPDEDEDEDEETAEEGV